MVNYINFQRLFGQLMRLVVITISIGVVTFGIADGSAVFGGGAAITQPLSGRGSFSSTPLLAYSIDYGMDQARGEKTIEYYAEMYGESLRDLIEQTLRNNEDHPDSKPTAQNTFRRESFFNDLLPKQRSTAFSKEDLLKLRTTENPREKLRK
jgi:hypothetical protein